MVGRILIISNQKQDVEPLCEHLKKKTHFVCRLARSENCSLSDIAEFKPDAIVLDQKDGEEKCNYLFSGIKSEEPLADIPILFFLNNTSSESYDFEIPEGVGDIQFRPLSSGELTTRLLNVLKKAHRLSDKSIICAGELEVDIAKYEVRVSGKKIDLTYTEYELLKFLASNPGQVFNRDVLLNKVWGYDYFGGARTVDVHVRRLRSKIEYKRRRFIDTVRNIGYKFILPDEG